MTVGVAGLDKPSRGFMKNISNMAAPGDPMMTSANPADEFDDLVLSHAAELMVGAMDDVQGEMDFTDIDLSLLPGTENEAEAMEIDMLMKDMSDVMHGDDDIMFTYTEVGADDIYATDGSTSPEGACPESVIPLTALAVAGENSPLTSDQESVKETQSKTKAKTARQRKSKRSSSKRPKSPKTPKEKVNNCYREIITDNTFINGASPPSQITPPKMTPSQKFPTILGELMSKSPSLPSRVQVQTVEIPQPSPPQCQPSQPETRSPTANKKRQSRHKSRASSQKKTKKQQKQKYEEPIVGSTLPIFSEIEHTEEVSVQNTQAMAGEAQNEDIPVTAAQFLAQCEPSIESHQVQILNTTHPQMQTPQALGQTEAAVLGLLRASGTNHPRIPSINNVHLSQSNQTDSTGSLTSAPAMSTSQAPATSQAQVVSQSQAPAMSQALAVSQSQAPSMSQALAVSQSQALAMSQSHVTLINQIPAVSHSQAPAVSQSRVPVMSQVPALSQIQTPTISQTGVHTVSSAHLPVGGQVRSLVQAQTSPCVPTQIQAQAPTLSQALSRVPLGVSHKMVTEPPIKKDSPKPKITSSPAKLQPMEMAPTPVMALLQTPPPEVTIKEEQDSEDSEYESDDSCLTSSSGGRSTTQDDPDDPGRLERRRYNNRVAAQRCRQRKRQHFYGLKKEIQEWECSNTRLRYEIHVLQKEMKLLTQVWKDHTTKCSEIGQISSERKRKHKHRHRHSSKKHRKSRGIQKEVAQSPIVVA